MDRFNLWVVYPQNQSSVVICYGDLGEMNDIAMSAFAGMVIDVHVLPDGAEPHSPATLPCEI